MENSGQQRIAIIGCGHVGATRTVRALVAHDANVNAKDGEGRTALMFAVINLHHEAVKALLEGGADVSARAHDGGTALILAADCGDGDIVQALLSKDADVSGAFNSTGKTALELATEKGHTAITELLKQAGAKK